MQDMWQIFRSNWMFSTTCWLAVGLGLRLRLGIALGLYLVTGWLMVMHTYLYYFPLWLSLSLKCAIKNLSNWPAPNGESNRESPERGKRLDAERMLTEVVAEAGDEAEAIDVAALQRSVDGQSTEVTQTGRARSERGGQHHRHITAPRAVHEHAAAVPHSAARRRPCLVDVMVHQRNHTLERWHRSSLYSIHHHYHYHLSTFIFWL